MKKSGIFTGDQAVFLSISILVSLQSVQTTQAQGLEEIVVTAQRRVQSLQDVPISIDTISGQDIQRQGYRDLIGLSDFTPGVEIRPLLEDTRVTVRGFGSTGNNLTQEQAVPIFADGVHFGRQEQAKLAFMDVDRIEILKGPQPVFFGQNATAGAFNVISRMPTPEWEGLFDGELGNNGARIMSGGVGGPITDTIGIRVAGKYESSNGFLERAIDGGKGPNYENKGGRVILRWNPAENFTATAKYDRAEMRMGGQAMKVCLTDADMVYGRNGPATAGQPMELAIFADPPKGSGWENAIKTQLHNANDSKCFTDNLGVSNSGPWYDVPDYLRLHYNNNGLLDVRQVAYGFAGDISDPIHKGSLGTADGREDINADVAYVNLSYQFDNGISSDWQTSYSGFRRDYLEDNTGAPFLINVLTRGQKLDQWSSEFRLTSDTGGTIEWMTGLSWQQIDYDIWTGLMRAHPNRGIAFGDNWEDGTWKSAFASLTFNFLDNKASIDIGGRYSDVVKTAYSNGYSREWVYNVEPVSQPGYRQVTDLSMVNLYVDYNPAAGLWYYPYNTTQNAPVEWRGTANAIAVGVTTPNYGQRAQGRRTDVPIGAEIQHKEFDPQVSLRYRFNEDMSAFFRYAEAFKSGGFDTGQITVSKADYTFEPEYSNTYEAGVKGEFWDGQARYDLTAFQTKFTDLQLITLNPDPNNPGLTVNAGGQRVRGVEFSVTAAPTDQLLVNLSGSLMDAVMTNFKGAGCNDFEVVTAPESGCVLTNPSDPTFGGYIDRTGEQAPYTPDWKFVFTTSYWVPVHDNHKLTVNGKGYISDGYFDDGEGFTKTVLYGTHGDLNLSIGYGDTEDTWQVSLYGRNLLGATPRYHPENTNPNADVGYILVDNDQTWYTTYGVKFEYNYK